MNIPKQWLHIGTDKIKTEQFQPIHNDAVLTKPEGGLWASPFQLDSDYYSQWQEFRECVWGKSKREKGVIFQFKKNTRIYVIDTQEDLIRFINEVGIAKSPIPYLNKALPDFEKAKDFYDVIYLTEQGQIRTRYPLVHWEYNLYGWDVESCLILNSHVIGKQMPIILE